MSELLAMVDSHSTGRISAVLREHGRRYDLAHGLLDYAAAIELTKSRT